MVSKLTQNWIIDGAIIAHDKLGSTYILSLGFEIIIEKSKFITIWLIYYILNNVFFALFLIVLLYEKFYLKSYSRIKDYDLTILSYLICIILFIFSAYIFRDVEIVYAIRTTMDRLIMTSSGFFVFPCIIKLVKILKIDNKKFL